MGVTIPATVGRRRARLRQLRARGRSARARPARSSRSSPRSTTRSSPSPSPSSAATLRQQTWLRRLATGEAIGAFALSEEHAGSDAANQQTVARLDEQGYVHQRPQGLGRQRGGGRPADPLCRDTAGHPRTRHQRVPRADGHARAHARRRPPTRSACAASGAWISSSRTCASARTRSLGAPGRRVPHRHVGARRRTRGDRGAGARRRARPRCDEALSHAKSREAFGQPIGNYQAIQWMLADIATELDAARLLTLKAADSVDRQTTTARDAARRVDENARRLDGQALRVSEAAHRAADKAMQILASNGYRRGSVRCRAAALRDVRATEIIT